MKVVEISCACGNKEVIPEKTFIANLRQAAWKVGKFEHFIPAGLMDFYCPECGQMALCLTKEKGD